jgi:hypothetical protein
MIADAIRGSQPGRELCLQQAHEKYERELLAAEAIYLQAAMEEAL